ncbi:MAG: biopolymer transporter ExbD [Phycisphaeraceae bacterium]|nr:biopolymer transporter ExbD [Phycisphaeraceae bacterium]
MIRAPRSRANVNSCQLNLAAMLDIVFQLIVFFMLISNIGAEEHPLLVVPELKDPQTSQTEQLDRIYVNVMPKEYDSTRTSGGGDGQEYLDWPGQAVAIKVGLETFSPQKLEDVTAALAAGVGRNPKVRVLVRADAALHFDSVQPVLAAIEAAGVRDVGLVALARERAGAESTISAK